MFSWGRILPFMDYLTFDGSLISWQAPLCRELISSSLQDMLNHRSLMKKHIKHVWTFISISIPWQWRNDKKKYSGHKRKMYFLDKWNDRYTSEILQMQLQNTIIKQVLQKSQSDYWSFWFPNAHKSYVYTILTLVRVQHHCLKNSCIYLNLKIHYS